MKLFLKTIVYCLPFTSGLLLLFDLFLSNDLARQGKTVSQLDKAIATISLENQQLRQQLASETSLITLENRAGTMGFTKEVTYTYLNPAEVAYQKPQ